MEKQSIKYMVQAANGKKPERCPIWFMRQAGRYLPEYRAVREKTSFFDLCRTPELASEVTIQPLRRFDVDASIIFSDILIPCTAFGQKFSIDKGHGPHLDPPIRSKSDFEALSSAPDASQLAYVGMAIELTKAHLKPEQTMIGFAGAPFTVSSYMIEGGPSKNFTEVKRMIFNAPGLFSRLMESLNALTYDYLKMQTKAGADALMLFDSWAANMAGTDYREHVFPHVKNLFDRLQDLNVPLIYYPGQGAHILWELEGLKTNVISVDWRIRLDQAADILNSIGVDCALQGNLDPQYLLGSEDFVRSKTRDVLNSAKKSGRPHIFNLGHGLLPHTPPESLTWVIDEVRKNT